jgi:hypothetical protein
MKTDRYKHLLESPLWWHDKASDLYASAGVLWVCMKDEDRIHITKKIGFSDGFDLRAACPSVCYMLWGLSFELLFKSIIVVRKFKTIPPTHHRLVDLAAQAKITLENKEEGILKVLSAYILWAGKYPIPKTVEEYEKHEELFDKVLYDKDKYESYTITRYNGLLEWDVLDAIWKRISSVFFEEYKKALA